MKAYNIRSLAAAATLLLGLMLLVGCTNTENQQNYGSPEGVAGKTDQNDILQEYQINSEIKITDEGIKYLVHPEKLVGGGPPKDGIPSIDNPKFESTQDADSWLQDEDIVFVYFGEQTVKVYPQPIMVWHEIVNDEIDSQAVLITYCPLCGSAIAYERTINGEPVEFGTSGKLYNSNLVMYDRRSDSYWTQIGGKAIVGPMSGKKLNLLSLDQMTWGEWKQTGSTGLVLSRDTDENRAYGRDPYSGYYDSPDVWFELENTDERLPPKELVYGIILDGQAKAYKFSHVQKQEVLKDNVAGISLEIRNKDGMVTIRRTDTNKTIGHELLFWFAWAAFNPATQLYNTSEGK